ncbi:MAG: hypothetical protein AB8G99_00490 [Planctomycetaceae bacterium]
MIRINCPSCKAALIVEPRLSGTTQECPGCKEPVEIPELEKLAESETSIVESDEFDPMAVLGAPEPTGTANAEPAGPIASDDQKLAAVSQVGESDAAPESGTASAANDAMNLMKAGPLPVARIKQVDVGESNQPIGEAFTSGNSFFERLGRRKLYGTLLASVCLALIVFLPKGCSDRIPVYPVSGRVVFSDGSPVKTGTIEFESQEHLTSSTGRIDDNGNFVLGTYEPADGAPAGLHKAIVMQMVISDGTIKHERDHGLPVNYKYRHPETSGLSFEIDAGENNLKVVVEPEPDSSPMNDNDHGE